MCAAAYGPTPGQREQARCSTSSSESSSRGGVPSRSRSSSPSATSAASAAQVGAAVAGADDVAVEDSSGGAPSPRASGRRGRAGRRRRVGRGSPRSPTSAATIRTVPDQAQLVVQIVLTTSSKTVALRKSGRRRGHPAQVGVGRDRARRTARGRRRGRSDVTDRGRAPRRGRCRGRSRARGRAAFAVSVTVRAPAEVGTVSSSVRASSSIADGGSATRPCDETVRQKSTGSPPAPTSSISALQARMRSRIFNARPGGGLPAA